MQYQEAKELAINCIRLSQQQYYNDIADFKSIFRKKFPGVDMRISTSSGHGNEGVFFTVKPLLDENIKIEFRISVSVRDISSHVIPKLTSLKIIGCRDKPPSIQEVKEELEGSLESRMKELKSRGFTDTEIESGMLETIKTLVSQWTLPDDRASFVDSEPSLEIDCMPTSPISIDMAIAKFTEETRKKLFKDLTLPPEMVKPPAANDHSDALMYAMSADIRIIDYPDLLIGRTA